jgi:TonB-linked SusC/RagA family outer membrane protein
MRKLIFFLLLAGLSSPVSGFSQSRVSLQVSNLTVRETLKQIEEKTDYRFFYSNDLVFLDKKVTLNVNNVTIDEALTRLFQGSEVSYRIEENNMVVIALKDRLTQGIPIDGVVLDESREPLSGVSVSVKGARTAVLTDVNGRYNITVPGSDAVLVYSFLGFAPQEIKVGVRVAIDVTLKEDIKQIDEVVVVGFGTQKKVNITGAVETIEKERIVRQPVASLSQALTGLTPGLTAIQSSGQPGNDGATLRIRGMGSINASNDPLILVDGSVAGDMNDIDMNAIESISILKDASSAAIYGARASNGVILITTKRAKEGKVKINYKNYFGWAEPTNLPKFLGALDHLKYSGASQAVIDNYAANMASDPYRYPDTDWVGLLLSEQNFQQYHNVSVAGGNEFAKMYASISYLDQGGDIVGFDFKRYNGRLNSDFKFSKKFDVSFDVAFSKTHRTEPLEGTRNLYIAFATAPIYPYITPDGSYADGFGGNNPIASAHLAGYNNRTVHELKAVVKANYMLFDGLNLSVLYSPLYRDGYYKSFRKTYEQYIDWDAKTIRKVNEANSFSQQDNRPLTQNFNATINYTKTWNDHKITALAGYEFVTYTYEQFQASRSYFDMQQYEVLGAGSPEYQYNSGTATHHGLVSYFGRLNYAYKERFLFEANIRRDASSRFYEDNRAGIFPSFSAGWRISEENFIKNNFSFISNLKLRASWGVLGNQEIGNDFPYVSLVGIGNANYIFGDEMVSGASISILANKEIRWESTEVTNFGIDAALLNNRLSFTFDWYKRDTKDILITIPIPISIGMNAPIQNIGNMENKGWDFSLNWQDVAGDFSYGARLNISDVRNKVTYLGGENEIKQDRSIIKVGYPLNSIYGLESTGIFQDDLVIAGSPTQFGTVVVGDIQYKDQLTVDTDGDGIPDSADGVINADDRVIIGDPFPRMSYGIDLNVGYKGFDFSVSMTGVGKRDVLLEQQMAWPLHSGAGRIQEWHVREFWSPEHRDTKYPQLKNPVENNTQTSSTWVFDASYMRIRNITLGYSLPKSWLKKISVEHVRIYVSGQNLFTFSRLPEGIDPLVPNGTYGSIYPISKNYIFGCELSF